VSQADAAPIAVNGWLLVAHPLFLDQLEDLISTVERLRCKDPEGYRGKNASKRLAAVNRLMFHDIPQDPSRKDYRQGSTLGPEHRHWHRAKFFQQYRLFFRFHNRSRVIVLGWVNDTDTKRAYGSKTDAYRVFQSMLANGHPPDDWEELLQEASQANQRLQKLVSRAMDPNDPEQVSL
jgi:toxin YhaV